MRSTFRPATTWPPASQGHLPSPPPESSSVRRAVCHSVRRECCNRRFSQTRPAAGTPPVVSCTRTLLCCPQQPLRTHRSARCAPGRHGRARPSGVRARTTSELAETMGPPSPGPAGRVWGALCSGAADGWPPSRPPHLRVGAVTRPHHCTFDGSGVWRKLPENQRGAGPGPP